MYVDEETRQNEADMEKVKSTTFWRLLLKKQLIEDLENVFPLFWKDEFKSKTKTALINLLTEYLKKMNENVESADGVNNTPPPEGWIRSQNCKHLANKRKEANKSFERKKNFFESCGTNIANRDRYKHNMELGENEDETTENT